jgi:hypothetical protein
VESGEIEAIHLLPGAPWMISVRPVFVQRGVQEFPGFCDQRPGQRNIHHLSVASRQLQQNAGRFRQKPDRQGFASRNDALQRAGRESPRGVRWLVRRGARYRLRPVRNNEPRESPERPKRRPRPGERGLLGAGLLAGKRASPANASYAGVAARGKRGPPVSPLIADASLRCATNLAAQSRFMMAYPFAISLGTAAGNV